MARPHCNRWQAGGKGTPTSGAGRFPANGSRTAYIRLHLGARLKYLYAISAAKLRRQTIGGQVQQVPGNKRSASAGGFRGFGATALALTLLAGCSTHTQPKPDAATVKQFAGRGYLADDQYGIATSFSTWVVGQHSVDIALTVPAKPGVVPLVIYLPALGETRSGGEAWRTAWAQSGYAVISFQPLAEDAKAWSSAAARSGEFSALARNRYAVKAMTARVGALCDVLAELARRQQQKEAPIERIDLTRIAIAGFDLGAYTAMAIAGENVGGVAMPTLPLPVAAVISLSPYADFSGAAFDVRYAGIRGPVLSVTGDNDADALGLVTSPSVRKAPFQYMPAGDKYLLTMADIRHATLSGGNAGAGEEGRAPDQAGTSDRERQSGGSGGRRGGRKGSRDASGSGIGSRSGDGNVRLSPTSLAIGVAAIQSVTTAFLDAYVRKDAIAREWLEKDAARWLEERGEIKRK
jgi:dienelactone hydrolase